MPDASDRDAGRLPLHGVRVVSTAANIPGPVAAARLRDLGASVVKVEDPSGDPLRRASADAYEELVEGVDVVVLDLRTGSGRARLDVLLADADVLLTSSRPASLARLALDWPLLHDRWPRLSQVAVLGSSGAGADRAGHDLTYQAHAGTLTPPQLPAVLVADLAVSERAVSEALAALLTRTVTGQGSYREVSLEAACADMARPLRWGLTTPGGPLGGALPGYRLYRASDGWIALAALEPQFLARVREALAVDGSAAAFERVFATRTAAQWQRWAVENDIPLSSVR